MCKIEQRKQMKQKALADVVRFGMELAEDFAEFGGSEDMAASMAAAETVRNIDARAFRHDKPALDKRRAKRFGVKI